MAKDILITPADGTLVFSGSASPLSSSFISDASGSLTLYLEKTGNQSFGIEGSGSTLLKVDGTQGRLFSITDEMSGSIFSANTIAGLPVIEAFSDNEVRFGPYSSPVIVDSSGNISGSATSTGSFGAVHTAGNVGIGTTAPGAKLELYGDAGTAIIRLHDPGTNSWKLKGDVDLHIYDDSNTDYLTILNSGKVGIGTDSPDVKLHITSQA